MRFKHLPSDGNFRPGQKTISNRLLNGLVDASIPVINGADGVRISEYGNRLSVAIEQPGAPLFPTLRVLSVVQEYTDVLLCAPFNFETKKIQQYDPKLGSDKILDASGNIVNNPTEKDYTLMWVAKPYLLQKTPWDGKTVNLYSTNVTYTYSVNYGVRTATLTGTSTVETQQITPGYMPGEIITARFGNTGYHFDDTKLEETEDDETGVITSRLVHFDRLVEWTDTNEGGRQWAAIPV